MYAYIKTWTDFSNISHKAERKKYHVFTHTHIHTQTHLNCLSLYLFSQPHTHTHTHQTQMHIHLISRWRPIYKKPTCPRTSDWRDQMKERSKEDINLLFGRCVRGKKRDKRFKSSPKILSTICSACNILLCWVETKKEINVKTIATIEEI